MKQSEDNGDLGAMVEGKTRVMKEKSTIATQLPNNLLWGLKKQV